MASTDPLHIHDDDEFDWEAAAKEIDVACQNTSKPPPSSSNSRLHPTIETHQKQSTLDKYFTAAVESSTLLQPQNSNAGGGVGDMDSSFVEVEIDAEAATMWIYPVNVPLRDYQLSITRTALFANTLVALPTGLGKTLIAAVVIYNYFRWFPTGKIVFAAPSRPLVMQQIEACHNVVGIPQEWTIDMTGQTSPAKRALFWKTKRVFFVTPQVLEKDIQSGSCMVKHLVCLVIDEAHRALGNYSYCTVVRELMAVPVTIRILALTATPGSKQQTVQQIIDNLRISSLEYRNETDQDVIPYVHDRKIELIQVAMGEDAVEINNLLWEVIRPFVSRLCSIGVLQNRDYQTLSPCNLLNSRDKFRQAPPPDLPQMKYGEVEGCFGVLITLYHIRKLLSGHGIRPSFEMLEEKLQQGSFARLVSKNEVLWKAKLLMQQSLSHGAPSPKLSKMIEVLIDHFKTKDPGKSRVIIFSNFRGSVRDIMSALANIGGDVKPTQFIGQSSGKTLKGQSQKVQQAVLEKFRSGGYNVIVATSIGEEGLDIMEVDLVICFDANISPLRMIQRMGRTGRKHEGRVVVLACDGSELKGYMRKQANSKAIKKHMRNGGLNSFNFHPSPRMIPHIVKPEVKFVELSIEQFILRGKKTRDDECSELPSSKTELIETEKNLIAKYFHPTVKSTWRPSLIVFPHFQAMPSTVHKVMHSFRTGMLIDAMQQLQGLPSSRREVSFNEDKSCSDKCFRAETAEQHDNNVTEERRQVSELDVLPVRTSGTNDNQHMDDVQGQNAVHSYIFGSDFISVDAIEEVLISSIPTFCSMVSHSKCTNLNRTMLVSCLKNDPYHCTPLLKEDKETTKKIMDFSAIQTKCTGNVTLRDSLLEEQFTVPERILRTLISKRILSYEENSTGETDNLVDSKTPVPLVNESSNMPGDVELSPRLTNFIESGIVPESPMPDRVTIREVREDLEVSDLVSPAKLHYELLSKGSVQEQTVTPSIHDSGSGGRGVPIPFLNAVDRRTCGAFSPKGNGIHTTMNNLPSKSSSNEWHMSSGGNSTTVEQKQKFKRLCKYGDHPRRRPPQGEDPNFTAAANLERSFMRGRPLLANCERDGKKRRAKARIFIEEEAEVSSEVAVSVDEEDEEDYNSCNDSFIDDGIELASASAQAEASKIDIMTIYRRSLLSQPVIERLPSFCAHSSPDSVVSKPQTIGGESLSESTPYSLQTRPPGSESIKRDSESFLFDSLGISLEANQCTSSGISAVKESKLECRKRKLFHQLDRLPVVNLEQEFRFQSGPAGENSGLQGQEKNNMRNGHVLDDDERFYEGIDFDAVEEQAAQLLRSKTESSIQNNPLYSEPVFQGNGVLDSPSFDLGI